jgi:hypothetical protein
MSEQAASMWLNGVAKREDIAKLYTTLAVGAIDALILEHVVS